MLRADCIPSTLGSDMSGESLRHLLHDTYDNILTIVRTILLAIVACVSCAHNFSYIESYSAKFKTLSSIQLVS